MPPSTTRAARRSADVRPARAKTSHDKAEPKEAAWLGVGVEESPEPLSAQLDLKRGEGLVVNFVATNSPAAAAVVAPERCAGGILDGQMARDPAQLQKLVQMHADGESVKIEFYRAGKKQSASAKLTMHTTEQTSFTLQLPARPVCQNAISKTKSCSPNWTRMKINLQVQHAMQQAQQAGSIRAPANRCLRDGDGLNHQLEVLHKKSRGIPPLAACI